MAKKRIGLMEAVVLMADIVIIALIAGEWWSGHATDGWLILGTLVAAVVIGVVVVCLLTGKKRR